MASQFACYVGLDWADNKHDVCIQFPNKESRQFAVIQHTPESIEQWITSLHKKCKGPIAVATELDKGPVVYALLKYSFVTLYFIPPLMLARYRQTFKSSGAKDDPTDAEYLLNILFTYPDKIKPLTFASDEIRELTFMTEQRRSLVEERRRLSNKLINSLKQYYPQPLDWFTHRNTELFCQFIIRWPTLQRIQRARDTTIKTFFVDGKCFSKKLVESRIMAIRKAVPLTDDKAVINSFQMLSVSLAKQMIAVVEQIRVFDKAIKTLYESMNDYELFESLPGAGLCLSPRLLAIMGEDRSRFESASEIQCYVGVAPVTERSGQKCWVHWRWKCSKFNRQTFVEWAEKTLKYSHWAKIYYDQKRDKGSTHQCAVRALAFKWIRILYRCWKDRTCYDEVSYLKTLRAKKSPLVVA